MQIEHSGAEWSALVADDPIIDTAATPVRERCCSVGRTVAILSDAWSFLVLREMFLGARRFEEIRSVLQLPRATLTQRLTRLTTRGLLRRVLYSSKPPRHEYRLTEMGTDLYLVMLSLLRFGDDWLSGGGPPPLQLVHATCGHECQPTTVCSACNVDIVAAVVAYRDGPGAGTELVASGRRNRRASGPPSLERSRPSSVSRALQVIGDRWSFLVVREAFFGVHRFDDIQATLSIAPNILSDRLRRLLDYRILSREKYEDLPERFAYRLTDRGRALYLPMIQMLAWGDRWLAYGKPPLILRHLECGHDFTPVVACSHCRAPLVAYAMRYRLNYVSTRPLAPAELPPSVLQKLTRAR